MKLHELSPAKGSKTAGRGEKGQKSRTGYSRRPGFEGGQMPLVRRVPKRGFTNIWKVEYAVVNLSQLAELEGDVTPEVLVERGLVRSGRKIKVLGDGEIGKALRVVADKFSKSAREKIEAAGGRCEEPQA
jgi:large subunit ribosomal protein L15